jgi:hypothetical protein
LALVTTSGVLADDIWEAQSPPRVWVYSLVGTDYNGHIMLLHFLAHYRAMGVPDEQFHFDLLHDPAEPDTGLKVPSTSSALLTHAMPLFVGN